MIEGFIRFFDPFVNLVYSIVVGLFPSLKKVKLDEDLCDIFVISDDLANH